jgi:hypothetical protein
MFLRLSVFLHEVPKKIRSLQVLFQIVTFYGRVLRCIIFRWASEGENSLAATIVYSNNTFHFNSHTTPSSNSHALEIFVSGIPKTQQRPLTIWYIYFLPGTTWCLPNGWRIARRWDACRSFCFDRRQFIEALWGRLAELGYMLFNYGYWESGIALDSNILKSVAHVGYRFGRRALRFQPHGTRRWNTSNFSFSPTVVLGRKFAAAPWRKWPTAVLVKGNERQQFWRLRKEESSRQRLEEYQWPRDDHGATGTAPRGSVSASKKAWVRRSARIKTSFGYLFFFYHVQFPSRLLVSSPFWGTVSILTSHIVPSWDATKSGLVLLITIVNVLAFSKPRLVSQYVLCFKGYFICLTLRGSYILLL